MSNNKSYRIRTDINSETEKVINVKVDNDYDILEILSLKFETENLYKLHTSKYGCVVGRVLANGGVGVPNAKVSIFIEADDETSADAILSSIYPYKTTADTNIDGIRYNLLPDEQVTQCHQAVGTMPNKRLVLDDNNTLEIFDKYYKFTTATNGAGDYMIMGVPVGNQTIHMDVDLSDIGFLSQKPIDMTYKGYNITQFENAQMFKKDTNLTSLVQIVSQDSTLFVNPFWGDEDMGETISITRHDINVDYKFEPTCIFMGSMITETTSNGFSKKCVPTPKMGRMDQLTTGSGTIEMIRKTPSGEIESFNVNGSELIDGNGVWCYQIPMNLDYITTDEYGNVVPTDNPEKGIATRTSVRFRISLNDFESDYSNNHLVKVLVPNNPKVKKNDKTGINYIDYDHAFGSYTKDESFKDLMWNNVYTVKSFIPRIQKGHAQRSTKFSGFKNVNVHGKNNPVPYNNMRVNITFMFVLQCAIIKTLIWVIKVYNRFLYTISGIDSVGKSLNDSNKNSCLYVGDGLCPDLEGWYFAPGCTDRTNNANYADVYFRSHTLSRIKDGDAGPNQDPNSVDSQNKEDEAACLTWETNYLIQCIEINLAMENEVIQFDFYNDWINGLVYIPRWFVKIKKKASLFFGLIKTKGGITACNQDFSGSRHYVQQCAMSYGAQTDDNGVMYNKNTKSNGCGKASLFNKAKCHKSNGRDYVKVLKNGGVVSTFTDTMGGNAYYAKPSELISGKKCNLFATDIVLLGSINSNNLWGIPSEFEGMSSSTFQMPPNLAMGNTDVDGVMYGVADTKNSLCDGRLSDSKSGKTIEKIEYTPTSFNKWVSDVNDKNFDDVTEYAVTELSGIDWGISGPNQGGIDRGNLFHPGGHFLGIACLNTEVNIKSCVNLSRICELGVDMSQRQSDIVVDDEEIKQEFTIPSGFISKHELSDGNYRQIFATLNHNNLKTKPSNHGSIEYDFINMQPLNFNGELKERVGLEYNSKYNALKMDDSSDTTSPQAYFRTFEETSKDYYNFRLGLHNNEIDNVKSKYLKQYTGGDVALPVYENSFYFYFGLTDGSTAIDKFLTNYYASCPTNLDKYVPNIEITDIEDAEICGHQGKITFEIENVSIPYTCIISMGNEVIYFNDFCVEDKIKIGPYEDTSLEGLDLRGEGSYTITIKNDIQGISISKEFQLQETLPTSDNVNFNYNSVDMTFNLYKVEPEITFTEKTIYIDKNGNEYETKPEGEDVTERNKAGVDVISALEEDMTESIKINKISAYDGSKRAPYIVGMVIDDGYFYRSTCLYNSESEDDKKNINKKIKELLKEEGYIELEDYNLKYDKETVHEVFDLTYDDQGYYSGHINHWGENKYNIRIIYSCETLTDKQGNLKKALPIFKVYEIIDAFILESTMRLYEFWIHDEKNNLSQIDDALTIEGYEKDKFGKNNKIIINVKELEKKLNNPLREWTIKKEIVYNKSIHEMSGHTISVGTVNGTAPYTETIEGDVEETKESRIFVREGEEEDVRKGIITLSNIMLPTESWMIDYKNEFNDIVEFELQSTEKKQNYVYSVKDGDGFPALFGIVYKEINSEGKEEEQEDELRDLFIADDVEECGCDDYISDCECDDITSDCECDDMFGDCDCDDIIGNEDESPSW